MSDLVRALSPLGVVAIEAVLGFGLLWLVGVL